MKLKTILGKIANILKKTFAIIEKAFNTLYDYANPPEPAKPYKCKVCHQWKKTASKEKGICKKCLEEME